MYVYRWPIRLLKDMNCAIRNFIWTGLVVRQKLVQVAWSGCFFLLRMKVLVSKIYVLLMLLFLLSLCGILLIKVLWCLIFLRVSFGWSLMKVSEFIWLFLFGLFIWESYAYVMGNCKWLVGHFSGVNFLTYN